MVKIKFIFNKEPVRVDFHKDSGMTHIRCEKIRLSEDIPTEVIPYHLRNISSRFLLTITTEEPETPEEVKYFEKLRRNYEY